MHDSSSTPWQPNALARKWHALAERRRNHLAELYQSGAWTRYFSEETLRAHLLDATREVERWAAMIEEPDPAAMELAPARPSTPRAA
ncbi:MAG TPA: TIGR03809 family protein [Xanthobacteraceae bacterium]|nr:TIGR03809 family protein [Xanthobacteraceae bacterium]